VYTLDFWATAGPQNVAGPGKTPNPYLLPRRACKHDWLIVYRCTRIRCVRGVGTWSTWQSAASSTKSACPTTPAISSSTSSRAASFARPLPGSAAVQVAVIAPRSRPLTVRTAPRTEAETGACGLRGRLTGSAHRSWLRRPLRRLAPLMNSGRYLLGFSGAVSSWRATRDRLTD